MRERDVMPEDAPTVTTQLDVDSFEDAALEMLAPLASRGYRRVRVRAPAVVLAAPPRALVLAREADGTVRFELGDLEDLVVDDDDEPSVMLAPSVSGFRVLALAGVTIGTRFEALADAASERLAEDADEILGSDARSAYARAVAEEVAAMDRARSEAEAAERAATIEEWHVRGIRVRELTTTEEVWSTIAPLVPGERPPRVFVVALPIGNAVSGTREAAEALARTWDDADDGP